MRKVIAKQLKTKALIIAKSLYKKDTSVKIKHSLPHRWQVGSPMWCYKQLKKAYKTNRRIDEN